MRKIWVLHRIDRIVAEYFESRQFPLWMDRICIYASRLGDYGAVWFFLAGICFFFSEMRWIAYMLIAGIVGVIILGEGVIKNSIRRKRPFMQYAHITSGIRPPRSFSFPSGHTAMSWCVVGILIWSKQFIPYEVLGVCIVLAGCISFSRIYLRVHYLSDVIAGILFWGACAQLVLVLASQFPII